MLIVEIDSSHDKGRWKFSCILNGSRSLHSPVQMMFHRRFSSVNDVTDLLATQWVDKADPFVGVLIEFWL